MFFEIRMLFVKSIYVITDTLFNYYKILIKIINKFLTVQLDDWIKRQNKFSLKNMRYAFFYSFSYIRGTKINLKM